MQTCGMVASPKIMAIPLEGVFWGYPTPKGVPKPNTQNKSFEWLDVSNDVFLSQAIESNTPIKKFVFQTLELEDIKVDPNPYFLVKKNPSHMSYLGINSVLNNFPTPYWELNPYRYQKALIVINSLSCFFVTFCALVLVMGKSTPTKENGGDGSCGCDRILYSQNFF